MFNLKKLTPYIFNLILIWYVFLIYKILPYYSDFLRTETITALFYLALAYTILGFLYHAFISKEIKETRGSIFFKSISRFCIDSYKYLRSLRKKAHSHSPTLEKHEKTTILFVLVKIFFLPLMLNFAFGNLTSAKRQLIEIFEGSLSSLLSIDSFNFAIFPLLLTLIFFIDTAYFAFGYAIESKYLKSKVLSVEPTIFGWVVALASYPPFNSYMVKYIDWYADDYILFSTTTTTFIVRLVILTLLTVYLSATIALGAKASNLTNRGIVSRGPYKYVRHPAYIAKNTAWWITIIPVFSLPAFLSMTAWSIIYHLRAITEERHLNRDPNYLMYKRKVKYRYIPFIY